MSLNRIIAPKEVGFSLEEIARILQEKPTNDQLRGMVAVPLMASTIVTDNFYRKVEG
jgi:DNA-binding transcriptional MerR regulator